MKRLFCVVLSLILILPCIPLGTAAKVTDANGNVTHWEYKNGSVSSVK